MARNTENMLKFIWKIENYSFCWNEKGEFIKSPDFCLDVFEGSSWCLKLYPRGTDFYGNYTSVYLKRLQTSEGPLGVTIDYEISLLRADGASECAKEMIKCCFRRGHSFGFDTLATRDEILQTKKSYLLPEDTLTVQCCIYPSAARVKSYTEITAKTHSDIERHCFLWVLGHKSFSFYGERGINYYGTKEKQRVFKIYISSNVLYVRCCMLGVIKTFHSKISIVDSNNSVLKILMDGNFEQGTTCCSTVSLITVEELMQKKSSYLTNDKLILLCDWAVSFGVQRSQIAEVTYNSSKRTCSTGLQSRQDKRYAGENNVSDATTNLSLETKSYSCTDGLPSSLQNDFRNLYFEGTLSDFTIKVENEDIPVHKAVLCARSPVFKAMLTSKMKETANSSVDISDLDSVTVRRMLTFMYTDLTDDLNWNSAVELYFAADKYGISKLKEVCSNVLKRDLCVGNVGEVLALADVHGDDDLKNRILEFICSHDTEVICSIEWKTFMAENVFLAAETMQHIFMKKAAN